MQSMGQSDRGTPRESVSGDFWQCRGGNSSCGFIPINVWHWTGTNCCLSVWQRGTMQFKVRATTVLPAQRYSSQHEILPFKRNRPQLSIEHSSSLSLIMNTHLNNKDKINAMHHKCSVPWQQIVPHLSANSNDIALKLCYTLKYRWPKQRNAEIEIVSVYVLTGRENAICICVCIYKYTVHVMM